MQQLQALSVQQPEAYLAALRQAADSVGDMLYSVLWVLDPSHIIVDCRYALAFQTEFISFIAERIALRLSASGKKLPTLSAAPLGMSSVLRGAVQVLQREWIERILA